MRYLSQKRYRKIISLILVAIMTVTMAFGLAVTVSPAEQTEAAVEWAPVATKEYKDIPTVDDDHQNGSNYIDIYTPDDGNGPYPVVLYIHGGSWISGSRTNINLPNTKDYLLYKGYAFVSVEYTLNTAALDANGNQVIWGGGMRMLYDVKAAVRYLRANAATYNLNTDYICAMGESAGATLAMLMATTNGSEGHEGADMGNAGYSSDVQAACSYYGPTYFDMNDIASSGRNSMAYILMGEAIFYYQNDAEILAQNLSPLALLSENTAPLYITHGADDKVVPVAHSTVMYQNALNYLDASDCIGVFYDSATHADPTVYDAPEAYEKLGIFIDRERDKTFGTYDASKDPGLESTGVVTQNTASSGQQDAGSDASQTENGVNTAQDPDSGSTDAAVDDDGVSDASHHTVWEYFAMVVSVILVILLAVFDVLLVLRLRDDDRLDKFKNGKNP